MTTVNANLKTTHTPTGLATQSVLRRAIAALALAPIFLTALWLGSWWLLGLLLVLAGVMAWEMAGLCQAYIDAWHPFDQFALVGCSMLLAASSMLGASVGSTHLVLTVLVSSLVILLRPVPVEQSLLRWAALIGGTFYTGALLPCLYLIRVEFGAEWTVLVIACTWAADTGAYFVGKSLGRHKLAPRLSPKKTIEGLIGGFLTAVLVAWGCVLWLPNHTIAWHLPLAIGVAVASVLFGVLGDLTESLLKRSAGIKDSSALIPGHGGFLDRFDAILFAVPVSYMLLHTFMGS